MEINDNKYEISVRNSIALATRSNHISELTKQNEIRINQES